MSTRGDSAEHRHEAARVAGFMMVAGAALAAFSVALPPAAMGSDAVVLGLGAVCGAIGAALLLLRTPAPDWLLGFAAAAGTVMITIATHEGGRVGTGTVDNVMLYIWICLLAFNYLSFPHALAQLALVGLCYGLLLNGEPLDEALTRWVISLSSLLVAGLLVYNLRSSRAQVVAELSERARNDALTGLLNRVALEERASLELTRARRHESPLSLIVLDIDRFKALNDSRGHPVGDEVLRTIASSLRRETREVDAVARLGGDEFAALLPGATGEDAAMVAGRLVGSLKTDAATGLNITLSVGVAEMSSRVETFETLWKAADEAMYEAKRAGGEAVRSASTYGVQELRR